MGFRTRLLWCLCAVLLAVVSCSGGGSNEATTTTTPTTTATTTTTSATTPGPLPAAPSTLRLVQERGKLRCGVNEGLTGFTNVNGDEVVGGFDPDFCRAIATAVLGDESLVDFVRLSTGNRFEALQNGDIDVLMRNTTRTSALDAEFDFGPTTYHDGQQLMGSSPPFRRDSTISELNGSAVCVTKDTTTEDNLEEVLRTFGVEAVIVPVERSSELGDGLDDATCDVITADGSALVSLREQYRRDDRWVIFPTKPISREPLGPVYRSDDSQWADIVNWTIFATIIADEKEIDSSNVADKLADPPDSEAALLLGGSNGLAAQLGLDPTAFYNVISQVGNYDEIFRNNLGPVGITRAGSLNAAVDELGLIIAPPIRAP